MDFGHWAPGTQLVLRSLAFEGGVSMGGMMGDGSDQLPDGAALDVCRFNVGSGAAMGEKLPQRLANIAPPPEPRLAVNAVQPKVFEVTMGMMTWGINGRGFDMLGTTAMETVKVWTQEVWAFHNTGRGSMMGMNMPHVIHVHGLQFLVLGRAVSADFSGEYDSIKNGLVDTGCKDTVLLMPGERIRILLRFSDHTGPSLYHCHMLEHEYNGLMRNYRVVA